MGDIRNAATGRDEAEAFLIGRYGRGVDHVTELRPGAWSRVYAFRIDERDLVVRFSALEEDFRKDELASRFASADLPIPAIVEVGTTTGGFYAISERAFGTDIEATDEGGMRARLPGLLAALDAMQLADINATTGYGIWAADGNAPDASWQQMLLDVVSDQPGLRHHGWRERLATSPTGDRPFLEAYRALERLVADELDGPIKRHLVHSDLLHRNVLASGDRITAVLDWGSSLYGDFLYDLAWITFWAPWYHEWSAIDFRAEAARHYAAIDLEVPRFEERLRASELHVGLSGQAYQAFVGHWSDLEWTAERTLEVSRGPRSPGRPPSRTARP